MSDVKRSDVFEQVKSVLVELFELNPDDVTADANLYQDLDLDSIDAVDLVVHLQNETGQKIKPEEFKAVRTVDDVVDAVVTLLQQA
ncbi:acyl carrier protein [Photobacterium aquae]|uniref:Acyl carrier protein n=1 Tax=Photobacterium aquae TaxID=1195763 RepID=A0A0J1GX94_9GAMM|nr:acyl carrier protein [Photobacterium aquae]KLV04069.1 acyl carrier protein [Photobacterium aquae]